MISAGSGITIPKIKGVGGMGWFFYATGGHVIIEGGNLVRTLSTSTYTVFTFYTS